MENKIKVMFFDRIGLWVSFVVKVVNLCYYEREVDTIGFVLVKEIKWVIIGYINR